MGEGDGGEGGGEGVAPAAAEARSEGPRSAVEVATHKTTAHFDISGQGHLSTYSYRRRPGFERCCMLWGCFLECVKLQLCGCG